MRNTLMRAFIQIDSPFRRGPPTLFNHLSLYPGKSRVYSLVSPGTSGKPSRDEERRKRRRGGVSVDTVRARAWRVAVAPAIFVRIRSRMLTAHGLDAACAAVTAISTRQPGRARPATRTQAREGAQPAGSHAFHTSFMPS